MSDLFKQFTEKRTDPTFVQMIALHCLSDRSAQGKNVKNGSLIMSRVRGRLHNLGGSDGAE